MNEFDKRADDLRIECAIRLSIQTQREKGVDLGAVMPWVMLEEWQRDLWRRIQRELDERTATE